MEPRSADPVAQGPHSGAPVFYYDLADPECYLAAERVGAVLPVAPQWQPVLCSGWEEPDRGKVERLARQRGLQPVRWPRRWPPDSRLAMRAAAYAKSIGRVTAFSLAAFRQAFAGGRDLDDLDTVVIAAAACEMHPAALIKALELPSVNRALAQATTDARMAGIERLPAVRIGELVFTGDEGLDQAAAAVAAMR